MRNTAKLLVAAAAPRPLCVLIHLYHCCSRSDTWRGINNVLSCFLFWCFFPLLFFLRLNCDVIFLYYSVCSRHYSRPRTRGLHGTGWLFSQHYVYNITYSHSKCVYLQRRQPLFPRWDYITCHRGTCCVFYVIPLSSFLSSLHNLPTDWTWLQVIQRTHRRSCAEHWCVCVYTLECL